MKKTEWFMILMTTCETARVFSTEFMSYKARGTRPCVDEPLCELENPGLDISGTASVSDVAWLRICSFTNDAVKSVWSYSGLKCIKYIV